MNESRADIIKKTNKRTGQNRTNRYFKEGC